MKSMNRKLWGVVEKDFVVLDPNNTTPRDEENLQLNDIAINTFYDAFDPKVFEMIKNLEMAHDVWKRLEESYEGIKAVKGAKLYILKGKWGHFKMEENEGIPEMFHRLQCI